MWGQKRVRVPWGEMDRARCAPFSTMHPSASFATLQDTVAMGFGLWGLGQEVFLGLSEHQAHCPGWGPVGGFLLGTGLHSSHRWRLLLYVGDLRRETKEM